AWSRAGETMKGTPQAALFQHMFGPSIPSYRVRTPAQPGDYELVFLDDRQRRLAAQAYRVTPGLRTTRQVYPKGVPAIRVNAVSAESETAGAGPLRITLENTTSLYLPALLENPETCPSIKAQPGLVYPGPGSLHLWVHAEPSGEVPAHDLNFALPHDL